MTTHERLANAPITEAIIDIRVKPIDGALLNQLKELNPPGYPICGPQIEFTGELRFEKELTTISTKQELGYAFRSNDHPYVCQFRINGFTLSRLHPYETWEFFREEAQSLWKRYRKVIGSAEIVRLAVRYINRIDLPNFTGDLSKYFRTRPEITESLAGEISGLMLAMQINQPDILATVNFRQTAVQPPPGSDSVVSIVLDIDIFRDKEIPQDERQIWEYFNEKLRKRKDDIFFGCITEATKELCR